MTVLTGEPVRHSTFVRLHGWEINETPVAFVEVERFFPANHVCRMAVPRDQSELGQVPDDEGVGCGFHQPIMRHKSDVFKLAASRQTAGLLEERRAQFCQRGRGLTQTLRRRPERATAPMAARPANIMA